MIVEIGDGVADGDPGQGVVGEGGEGKEEEQGKRIYPPVKKLFHSTK